MTPTVPFVALPLHRDCVYIPVRRQLLDDLSFNGQWSKSPLFVKVIDNDDGTAEIIFQRPAPR